MTQAPADHCPTCGAATEARRIDGRTRRYCPSCATVVWQNPIPFASVAVVDGDTLLLARRAIDPGKGEWNLPGGFLEADESPRVAAARELREEVAVVVEPGDLALVDAVSEGSNDERYVLALLYVVSRARTDGEPVASDETSAVRWVSPRTVEAEDLRVRPHLQGRLQTLVDALA